MSNTTQSILCLSSNLRLRWAEDILRCVALPSGARLQFRYSEDIIEEALRKELAEDELADVRCLLAHVSCVDVTPAPIVPCRWAHLVSSSRVGTTYILELELDAFYQMNSPSGSKPVIGDLMRQRKESIVTPYLGRPRHWAGTWCARLPETATLTANGIETARGDEAESKAWEAITRELAGVPAFAKVPFFLRVLKLRNAKGGQVISPKAGRFPLRTGKQYKLSFQTFWPQDEQHLVGRDLSSARFVVDVHTSGPGIALRSSGEAVVDCPYDVHEMGFETLDRSSRALPIVTLLERSDDAHERLPNLTQVVTSARAKLSIDLPIEITRPVWKDLVISVVIGLALLWQKLVGTDLSKVTSDQWVTLIALSLVIGLAAAFGIRRQV